MSLKSLSTKHLLLCEGMHDAEFFEHLLKVRSIPHEFTIASCGYAAGSRNRDGIGYLTDALDQLPTLAGFYNILEAILIVADNDGNPAGAFTNVVDRINATANITLGTRYVAPSAPLLKSSGTPAIVVFMLPSCDNCGSLDSLCFAAAAAHRSTLAGFVDQFAKSCGSDTWPVPKDSKMKLRSLISAAHQQNPYLSPTWVWKESTDLVPLKHATFDGIETFLRSFSTFM